MRYRKTAIYVTLNHMEICPEFVVKLDLFHFCSPAPNAPPKDIEVVSQTLYTITISWKPVDCAQQNGKITGYIVEYQEMEDRDEKRTNVTVNGTHCTLRDLQSATTYVIKVAAKTSAGVGVFGNLTASISLCKYQSVGRRSMHE